MGVEASVAVLGNAVTTAENFVTIFVSVYAIIIVIYIISSLVRLPYSPTLNRVQRFLYDVCEPYIRLFRRVLPPLGPLDLSPMVAIVVLFLVDRVAILLLDQLK
ncbi:MAG: YggT family protein [Gaiellaceae bacterium]